MSGKPVLVFLMLLGLGQLVSGVPGVKVTSPNGGECWQLNAAGQISRSFQEAAGSVRIVLYQGGTGAEHRIGTIAENVPLASGAFSWTVGQYLGGTVAAGSGFRIYVRVQGSDLSDYSDSGFTILPDAMAPALELASPNGGEDLKPDKSFNIGWSSTGLSGNVQLELVKSDGTLFGVIVKNLAASGSYSWQIGTTQSGTAPAGKYRVRVRSQALLSVCDESDADFNIVNKLLPNQPLFAKKKVLYKKAEKKSAVYQNWMQGKTVPSGVSPPPLPEIFSSRPRCETGGANKLASVGVSWFSYYTNIWAVAIHRSQLKFYLSEFQPRAAQLKKATLKLRQVSAMLANTNKVSCAMSLSVFLTPWSGFDDASIDRLATVPTHKSECAIDITATVRKWLDGTLANNGLLLTGQELCERKAYDCISCFEAWLELEFQ